MAEDVAKKINALARRELRRAVPGEPIEVLLRLAAPMTDAERGELLQAGCKPASEMGNVVSARIENADRVADVARLPFVRAVDVSRVLYSEPDDSSASGGSDEKS